MNLLDLLTHKELPYLKTANRKKINFYPKFVVRNSGGAIEHDFKVEIAIPSALHDAEVSPIHHLSGNYCVFSIPGKAPIFQQELYTIAEAKLSVKSNTLETFLDEWIHISIYYSVGKKSIS